MKVGLYLFVISVVTLVENGHCGKLEHDLLIKHDPAFQIKFPFVLPPSENLTELPQFGHFSRLGTQRQPIGQVPEYFEDLSPRELWDKHGKLNRPAVLRGLLNGSPALEKWSDEYLIDEYGDQDVLVEKKVEDRKSEPKRMSIKGFLNQYKLHNWYVVSMLPDLMKKDIKLPKPLTCSTFRENLQELNLWIGTHGTRSMLHHDADNIIHCLVAGRKDWILFHPNNKLKLDFTLGAEGQGSGYSHLNVDSLNLNEQAQLTEVPWEYATLYAGDCLYLPAQYIHQVRSYNRSISATFLSYPRDYFNDDDCKDVDMNKYTSLEDAYVFWGHQKDQETVDMGYGNPVNIKQSFVNMFKVLKMKQIDFKAYLYFLNSVMGNTVLRGTKFFRKIFQQFDKNSDNTIDISECENADIELFKQLCRYSDAPHGPTKSQLDINDQKTDKSPEFNPRSFNHLIADAIEAKTFLKVIVKDCGKGGFLLYPQFKSCVRVFLDEPASAFVIIDPNLDGVLTSEELKNLPYKQLREFAKLGYRYKQNPELQGGGMWETDYGRVGVNLESEEENNDICLKELFRNFYDMADTTRITKKKFVELTIEYTKDQSECKTDPDFLFHILDRENEGFISKYIFGVVIGLEKDLHSRYEVKEDEDIVVRKERHHLFDYADGVHALIEAMQTYIEMFEKYKEKRKPEHLNSIDNEMSVKINTEKPEEEKPQDNSHFSDSDESDFSEDESDFENSAVNKDEL